ncbi:division/cell wall cluster transcriptional repressor MraZ [Mycoplasmopsis canis]|uniref:Transcriptional regulator MraZ n=1 Tax=Mycoplasmopsis canis TaxID=29555 RepID=A0A0F6X1T0_9BACT|nr:cell division protein MraZ [Mycoplasmopsis canis]AKF41008.1 cell division protein MraZ [Mycoplasmopsis canis]AMD81124.1 division/cell wall cluster transcriptional repressor MraZ [Mycoplasmopsis canis PG 14]EIE39810.1 cell division protein MraZ [Mycoplasmopsis canis PG 14]EIE40242.1 cell division protein MraZ [Mycoplasmopsis canis UF33]EIE41596.1 cell division protein MraZ [Mycoplasmopsis canis UFG1]
MVNIIYGLHSRNADDKNRVILPPAIREYLGTNFMVSIGFDGNADLRTKEEFMKYIKMLEDQSSFDKRARIITRSILGNSFEVTLDAMNRISLPKHVVEKLAIQKEVIFIGAGTLVEMWSKEMYDNFESEYSADDIAAMAQEISLGK